MPSQARGPGQFSGERLDVSRHRARGRGCCCVVRVARTGELTENPLSQADVYRMIRRRALAAGIRTQIGYHTFRATGITEYLRNAGKPAAHGESRVGAHDRAV